MDKNNPILPTRKIDPKNDLFGVLKRLSKRTIGVKIEPGSEDVVLGFKEELSYSSMSSPLISNS